MPLKKIHYKLGAESYCRKLGIHEHSELAKEVTCLKCIEMMPTVNPIDDRKEHKAKIKVERWGNGWGWTLVNKQWEMNSKKSYKTEKVAYAKADEMMYVHKFHN